MLNYENTPLRFEVEIQDHELPGFSENSLRVTKLMKSNDVFVNDINDQAINLI